jgi:GNAT superfamily N-acetyltransferase
MEEVYELRVRAWAFHQPLFSSAGGRWTDAYDEVAAHFVITKESDVVAAARYTIHDRATDGPDGEVYVGVGTEHVLPPIAVISRLVVCPRHSKRGLSDFLDNVRIEHARQRGCRSVLVCTSSGSARLRQLQEIGFRQLYQAASQVAGPLEGTPPPTVMALPISQSHAV